MSNPFFFINGRFLTQRLTGVQRFAHEILRASSKAGFLHAKNAEILVPAGYDTPDIYADIPVRAVGRFRGHIWEQIDLPRAVREKPLINLCNTAPIFLRRQGVVLHDAAVAAFPQNHRFIFRAWYHVMIRLYAARAQRIATVSHFSAQEIQKHFGIPAHKITLLPESGAHILRVTPDDSLHHKFDLKKNNYFLAVSSHAPNKNFSALIEALRLLPNLPFKAVIVGAPYDRIFKTPLLDTQRVTEVGYVTDGQLRALYEGAACFVYPSLYEGFGLPPVEAMSCGCPALVARAASLPEICGDAAVYCDPHDPRDIAFQLSRLLEDKTRRETLRRNGLVHAQKWDWENAAYRLWAMIKDL